MKTIHSIVMMLAMMVAAAGFVACGDDDEDDVIGGGNSSTPSLEKRLVRMTIKDSVDYKSNMYHDYSTFTYSTFSFDDEGRIIQSEGDEKVSITYDDLYITVKGNAFHILHTIYNGKIVESVLSLGSSIIEVRNIYKDDNLTERAYIKSTGAIVPNYEKFFWNDGNMVKIEKDYYDKTYGETIIEYSKYKDINGLISSILRPIDTEGAFGFMVSVGYLGKFSKNLPIKKTSTHYYSTGNVDTRIEESYEWEIMNDIPIKVTVYTETHGFLNDCKKIATCTFEWE